MTAPMPQHRLPEGVLRAEHEAAIIAEQRRAEMKIVAECEHDDLRVHASYGGGLDDHSTSMGYCPTCDQWVTRTDYANGRSESTLMNDEQKERMQRWEDRYRRSDAS